MATFNSGFKLVQSRGGWYLNGVAAVPLRAGAASFVVYRNGTATVGTWGRDVGPAPSVVAVRQNLSLLVDGGAPTPAANGPTPIATWGDPLHEQVLTWRSGLGIDAAGHLLYLAGPALDPRTLATALVAVGAVRAMELDINPEWVSFDAFAAGTPPVGQKLMDTMYFPVNHFLNPFWRDFIAAFVRSG